jgi:3-oxoacyl-[acyl-carrier protein] reductase
MQVPSSEETRLSNLDGKVALVTGSSRGIGASIARVLAEHGAAVAVHGRDASALERVRAEIERSGGNTIAVSAELTAYDGIEEMRLRIERELGAVDILITNAGGAVTPPVPFEEISEESWRASIDHNLLATFLTLKSFLPGMKARKAGNIVTMSSAAARRAHEMSPVAYSAAKAGIQILTQHLAKQVGAFGIRVNCIAPEAILTDRNDERMPPEVQRKLAEEHPLRRLGTPNDVAQAALFLASDDSAWITGIVLDVAGGAVMP